MWLREQVNVLSDVRFLKECRRLSYDSMTGPSDAVCYTLRALRRARPGNLFARRGPPDSHCAYCTRADRPLSLDNRRNINPIMESFWESRNWRFSTPRPGKREPSLQRHLRMERMLVQYRVAAFQSRNVRSGRVRSRFTTPHVHTGCHTVNVRATGSSSAMVLSPAGRSLKLF